jgi:hypothetical protein
MERHQWRVTVGENQNWKKEIVAHWDGLLRKITQLLQHKWQQNWIYIHPEDPISTKSVRRELHKSKIHDMAVIPKPLITESNAQMRRRLCHDRKSWTSDKWKHARDMVRWVVLHDHPYISKNINVWGAPKEAYNSECLVPTMKHWRFCVGLGRNIVAICWSHYWSSWPNYCKGVGSQATPIIQTLFSKNNAVFQDNNVPFTQLELFSPGSKNTEVNFTTFPVQHNHQISTSLNHCGQFWRLEWGTDSQLQHL